MSPAEDALLLLAADRQPPRLHDFADLAALAGQPLDPVVLAFHVFAVEARYEEGHSR